MLSFSSSIVFFRLLTSSCRSERNNNALNMESDSKRSNDLMLFSSKNISKIDYDGYIKLEDCSAGFAVLTHDYSPKTVKLEKSEISNQSIAFYYTVTLLSRCVQRLALLIILLPICEENLLNIRLKGKTYN